MWYLTDAAEWFEKKRHVSDDIVDSWVENSNYSVSTMVAGSVAKSVMTFGAGFVDLLRIGDGVKEGSLKGAGTDALRVLAIFPVGKTLSLLKTARGVTAAKFVVDTGGPNCFWVASAKAVKQLSLKNNGRLLVSVEDLASGLGMSMKNVWIIPNLSTGLGYLKRLGVKSGAIRKIASHADVEKMLPRNGSLLMLAVKMVAKPGLKGGGHAFYAFRNSLGQVRYMDRSVGRNSSVYVRMEDMLTEYPSISSITPYEGALLVNMFARTVGQGIEKLFIPVLGVIAEERN